jgi:hypothetical protein
MRTKDEGVTKTALTEHTEGRKPVGRPRGRQMLWTRMVRGRLSTTASGWKANCSQ